MKRRESTFKNMVITLFLVTFIAAAGLGYVYDLTKEPIATAKLKAQNEAIRLVLSEFNELGRSFKVAGNSKGDSLIMFPAYSDGELMGVAVKTYTYEGFSGFISLMVGFDKSGNITGYEVLEHAETPGLGSKMDPWFKVSDRPNQNIIGKNPSNVKFEVSKDGGDIDAITASTITSRAFLDAVVRGYNTFIENKYKTQKESVKL